MKKLFPSLACAAIVCGAAIGARALAAWSWRSVVEYHTPYLIHDKQPVGVPVVDRVLLVVIDGLRVDTSRTWPALNALRAKGADGVARVGLPSLSNPARAVMATGAWQEVNGVTNNTHYVPPEADSIFTSARAAKIPVAVAGIDFWYDNYGALIQEKFPKFPKEPHNEGPVAIAAYQHTLCDGITTFLHRSKARLMIVDLSAVDIISHDIGPASPDAEKVFQEVNDCTARVVADVNLDDSVVVVTSDHGHIDTGGHGGAEEIVLNTPLIMAGQHVRHVAGLAVHQVDIAATVCALLGLPFPATNQGRFVTEAFDLPDNVMHPILERWGAQRALFHEVQTRVLGSDREAAPHMAIVGRTFEATAGLLLVLLMGAWILLTVCESPAERASLVGAVAAFYLVYFAAFRVMGLAYSLSAVNKEEFLNRFFTKGMAAAAIALVLSSLLMAPVWRRRPTGLDAVRLCTALAASAALSLMAQVALVHWFNGLLISLWMFDLTWAFKAYLDLLALVALPFAMCLSPLLLMVAAKPRAEPIGVE